MFSFSFCWSIAIHAALVMAFGITEFSLPGESFSSNETCVNVSREIVCLFKGSEEPMAWNSARRLCSSFSATLPVIRNRKEQNALAGYLKSHVGNTAAWTAGRKAEDGRWTWIKGGQLEKFDEAESKDEVRYTNWDKNQFSKDGECISISTSNGKWKALGCDENLVVVCQKGQGITSALTTVTTVENIQTRLESSTLILKEDTVTTHGSRVSMLHSSAVSVESITYGSQDSTLNSLWFLILVAAIVIIICLIVFVLRVKNRSVIEIFNSKFNVRSTRSNREELHTCSRRANAYAIETSVNEHGYVNPAIAAVERSDDLRDDYEEISSLQLNQSEDGATEQQPGIVYASLAKETDNQEPDQKCAHPTSPTKIGPLGDIYAMPDVGIVSGAHNNHLIKVTAQGDVYALPMQRSKSSTSNNPGEVVYVNLPKAEKLGKEQAAEAHVQTK